MKKIGCLLLWSGCCFALLCFSVSCTTKKTETETDTYTGPVADYTPPPIEIEEEPFDTQNISEEFHASTKEEVQQFIEELNRIINRRDFASWKAALSPEYFAEISSRENLEIISEQPAMKTRRIVLRTAEDYFRHVVVPSRASSRVDDIEFVDMNRVKAFSITINKAGVEQKLRLYDLEKNGDVWKIIN